MLNVNLFFLQLIVYCILTSINSMMDLFLNKVQTFVNGVNVLFTVGQLPYAPETVCALMLMLLVHNNSTMNRFLMQFEGFFIITARYFFNGVEAIFPNTVGRIPHDAKIVMAVFLMIVVCLVLRDIFW